MDQKDIQDLVAQNRKIAAIKLYRERYGVGLLEAKNAVDAMAAGQTALRQGLAETRISPHTLVEDPEMLRQIEELIRAGDKIHAIKLYRTQTGAGLKDSKDAIDAWAVRIGATYRRPRR